MKEFDVSIDISTNLLSLTDLSARLHREPYPFSSSHDKSDLVLTQTGDREPWATTIWRMFSRKDKSQPLHQHLEDLVAHFPPKELLLPGLLPEDCKVQITIGVYYDTATVSLFLSQGSLDIIQSFKAAVEVVGYPIEVR